MPKDNTESIRALTRAVFDMRKQLDLMAQTLAGMGESTKRSEPHKPEDLSVIRNGKKITLVI